MAHKTVFITGASRGIGEAIELSCAKDGADVIIAAKTAKPHTKLPRTIYSVAEKVESLGGKALPIKVDFGGSSVEAHQNQSKRCLLPALDKPIMPGRKSPLSFG